MGGEPPLWSENESENFMAINKNVNVTVKWQIELIRNSAVGLLSSCLLSLPTITGGYSIGEV